MLFQGERDSKTILYMLPHNQPTSNVPHFIGKPTLRRLFTLLNYRVAGWPASSGTLIYRFGLQQALESACGTGTSQQPLLTLTCKFLANAHTRVPGSCSEDPLAAPSYEELSGKMSMRSSADKGANCFLGYTQNSIYQTLRRGVNPTVFIMGCTLLEHCVRFWAPQFKRDVKVLERIQKKVTKGWEECPTRSS